MPFCEKKNHNIQVANKYFNIVEKFLWCGKDNSKSKSDHKGNTERVNLGKTCYHSAQNILASLLLRKTYKNNFATRIIWVRTCLLHNKRRSSDDGVQGMRQRKMSGPEREELTGKRGAPQYALLPNVSRCVSWRRTGCVGHVARVGVNRNWRRVLVGKPEVKRTTWKLTRTYNYNIKMDVKNRMLGCRVDLSGWGHRQVASYRDHRNTFSVSTTADNFFSPRADPRSR